MKQNHFAYTLAAGGGIFRLAPTFVPRRFSKPGLRLRLHPDDYYALGTKRGAIKERWFSSIINCMNGPDTAPDEGLSYVVAGPRQADVFTLKDAVETLGVELLGNTLMDKYGTWPMYSKFFDFLDPLFHHVHLDFQAAAQVERLGKPEAYYYPPQYNNYPGNFPHTFFGFDPDVTKDQVRDCLLDYENRDTRITALSRAYRIELGTGWYTPPGVIHAPGSYLTYEPQWNSDVNSVYENITSGEIYPKSFLNENCPADRAEDVDYILGFLDWEKNTEPHYKKRFFRPPVVASESPNHVEKWVAYGNDYIAAKELTVLPGCQTTITDNTPYGCIVTQGRGKFGEFSCAEAGMLRFGQRSEDEYFVSYAAAQTGVEIINQSAYEPLVILKHFPVTLDTPACAFEEV